MNNLLKTSFCSLIIASITGCAICCSPYYDDYPTFGGKVQRTNREWGRVGSVFSDPYTGGSGPSADSNLKEFLPDDTKRNIDSTPKPKDVGGEKPEELPVPDDTPKDSIPPLLPPKKDNDGTQPNSEIQNQNSWIRSGSQMRR